MKTKKPFRPTRMCPHRFCRHAHKIILIPGLIIGPLTLSGGLAMLAVYLVGALLVGAGVALITRKPVTDAVLDMLTPSRYLIVRPVWARIAGILDILLVAFLYLGFARILVNAVHPDPHAQPLTAADALHELFVIVPVMLFYLYAHWKATQPAKPKRVLVPARETV